MFSILMKTVILTLLGCWLISTITNYHEDIKLECLKTQTTSVCVKALG